MAHYVDHMNPRRSTITAAAAVVALVLGSAACSSDDDEPSTAAASSESAEPSTGTPGATGGDVDQASFFEAMAAAQTDAGSTHFVMELSSGGRTRTAEGHVQMGESGADTSMAMSMGPGTSGAGSMKMVVIDGAFYLNLGEMTQDKFAKVDLGNPVVSEFFAITEQLDPSKQLDQFSEALTSFEKKGEPEHIDGVDAQPYELVLDTSKIDALGSVPGAAASLPETLTYTMFIGPDNLVRRLTSEVDDSSVAVTYSQWGKPVDVQAPPAGEISDKDLSQLGRRPVVPE